MWLLPAPRSASISRCMRLSGKAATVFGTFVPKNDRARVRLWHHREVTRQPGRWPGRFPPDGAPIRPGPSPGDDAMAICGPARIPAVLSAPPSGSSRRRGRLVCVPLRHVLPIGVSGEEASDPVTFVSSPSSGGRPLQRAGTSSLRQLSTPAPAPPRLTSHRQVYPRAGTGTRIEGWKRRGMKKHARH